MTGPVESNFTDDTVQYTWAVSVYWWLAAWELFGSGYCSGKMTSIIKSFCSDFDSRKLSNLFSGLGLLV